MNSAPRPKPWESQQTGIPITNSSNVNNNETNTTLPPEVPPLPDDSTTAHDQQQTNSPYSLNNNINTGSGFGFGNGMNYGGGGMYGNGMNYGGGMYGNNGLYGGGGMYGNTYGGGLYGNSYGYGGMNNGFGFGGGMNGPPGIVTESTMATFQLLENLIGAINGFAQMLESSYMATYNSFFTLVSFAEELNRFKQMIGSLLGMFNIVKLMKRFLKKKEEINTIDKSAANELVKEFQQTVRIRDADKIKKGRRLAWKPLILFFMGVFGFPYLLKKYINRLQNNHVKQLKSKGFVDEPIDPMNLEFAKALYDFIPENPTIEIMLKKGDLMAIISKRDTIGKESSWWRVRTKHGEVGYVPSNYIEIIKRRKV